ncbi:MAG: HAD family hydrolase [Pseudomonadales bacterium]|nr:HAD family hydrolase [Pseudomonadales bacterium]
MSAGSRGADIRVITFDLDNTLWDVEPTLLRAEQVQQDWLRQHRPGTVEAFDHEALWKFKQSVWKRHPELLHHVSQMRIQMLYELQLAAGYPEEQAMSGAREAFAVFLEERHRVTLYEDALVVLRGLAARYTLGALTNGNADIYKTDAGEYFDFAFLAEDVGAAKPHPDMFEAALSQAGVAAHQIVHVGDNPEHDICGAREVGMHTVWMNSQGQPWPDLPPPDREIDNLLRLPEAIASLAR